MKSEKLLLRLAEGAVANVRFADFRRVIEAFGFVLKRVSGSHHVFSHPEISELVNLQEVRGQAKPYQIRQFLKLVERYNLKLEA
jgi:predicted RNA binding protein YcfA (HicA-like mRNA interferase family)